MPISTKKINFQRSLAINFSSKTNTLIYSVYLIHNTNYMTEKEKMLNGDYYDSRDKELIEMYHKARKLLKKYNNLDSESSQNLHELFFKLRDEFGQTFVIVTHNKELAAMADRTLEMRDGNIIQS